MIPGLRDIFPDVITFLRILRPPYVKMGGAQTPITSKPNKSF